MARSKQIGDRIYVSTVLSRKQRDRIEHMAIRMSSQEERQIGISKAIRMAIETEYPLPKNQQIELFDGN